MLCGALIETFLYTNAGSVAFLRSSYSNEFRYRSLEERIRGLSDPTEAGAREFAQGACLPRQSNRCLQMPDIRECGVGLKLFFFSLRYFSAVFGLMTLLAIGQVALNYQDNYYGQQSESLSAQMGGSLGGVQTFSNSTVALDCASPSQLAHIQTEYEEIMRVKALEVGLDAGYTFIFLLSLLIYRIWTKRLIRRHRAANPTLSDYSLKFTHLPEKRIPALLLALEKAQIGVFDLVPVRHINKLVAQIKYIKQYYKSRFLQLLIDEKKNCTPDEVVKSIKKLIKLEVKVKKEETMELSHSVIVVFESKVARAKAVGLFQQGWRRWVWGKLVLAWRKVRRDERGRERDWLKETNVKSIPTPEDYYWENIRKKRWIHRLKFYALASFLILASSGVIFGFKFLQTRVSYPSESECQKDYNATESDCECVLNPDSESCKLDRAKWGSAQVFIGFAIVVVNMLLPWLLQKITCREKQSSKPRRKLSTMMKVFFALLINTSVVILAVNARFRKFRATEMYNQGQRDKGYSDFDRGWYSEVGFSILVSMIFGVFAPHYLMCFYYKLKEKCQGCMKRFFDTQLAYNNWVIGADMDLPLKTAIELVTIYACFIYAGGLPWMIAVCSVSLLATFHAEKYMLSRYERPNERSTILHAWFVKMIPWAIVLHCLVSIYMYGCEDIFPLLSPQAHVQSTGKCFNYKSYKATALNNYDERVRDYPGPVFLALLGVAVVLQVLAGKVIKRCRKKTTVQETVAEALAHPNFFGGKSYHMTDNCNYREIVESVFEVNVTPDPDDEMETPLNETAPILLPAYSTANEFGRDLTEISN